jgi:predicted ester cyclase
MEAFYRRYMDANNAHEFTRLGEFVAEDVTINGEPHGIAAYIAGLEAVVAVFPDFHWDLRHLLVDEPWLAAHFIDTGTHAVTGRRVTTQEFAVYRIEAETIVEVWGDLDRERLAADGGKR